MFGSKWDACITLPSLRLRHYPGRERERESGRIARVRDGG